MQNFGTLRQPILVETLGPQRRRRQERGIIMPLRVATTFMPAAQGQRTHSVQTKSVMSVWEFGEEGQTQRKTKEDK